MRNYKFLLIVLAVITIFSFILVNTVLAGEEEKCPEGQICNPLQYDSFKDLASAINRFIFILAMALAPILFVIAGTMIVTAGGNPLQVQKAQKIMIYTAVGLVVILLAQAFVAVLKNVIGVEEAETFLPLIFSSLGLELRKRKVE